MIKNTCGLACITRHMSVVVSVECTLSVFRDKKKSLIARYFEKYVASDRISQIEVNFAISSLLIEPI